MRRWAVAFLFSGCALALTACDVIRVPWDGGPPPKTPEAPAPVPPGAPGPPPPSTPVEDPYGTGDTPATDPATPQPSDGTTVPPSDPATPGTDAPPTDEPATPPGGGTSDGTPPADGGGTPTPPVATPAPEPQPPVAPVFSYFAPGALMAGTGQGQTQQIVHAPGLVFPIKDDPAYLQSMVFTFGGGVGGGDQCDARNYAYPWRDNFCETRSANRGSPFCPTAKIHQGQDIRVGTPDDCKAERRTTAAARERFEAVAVADGVISNVGTYSVSLRTDGAIYKYMHLNMEKLKVTTGQFVKAGDLIGYVSNDFGGTPTVLHLHFEIVQNTPEHAWAHVPPYLSLVEAYERREKGPGERIEPGELAVAEVPVVIPEGFEIIE